MVLLLVEGRHLFKGVGDAIHAHARETRPLDLRQGLLVAALAPFHRRRVEDQLRSGGKLQDRLHDLLRALSAHGLAALRTVRHAHVAVEETQIVVYFRDGGHNRTRVTAGGALFDGDGGGQPLEALDVRLLHLVEELASVRAQRLHVPALSLGVERVKRERGLAAPREPRHDGQRIARDAHVDVAQVVDFRTFYDDICHVHLSPKQHPAWRILEHRQHLPRPLGEVFAPRTVPNPLQKFPRIRAPSSVVLRESQLQDGVGR